MKIDFYPEKAQYLTGEPVRLIAEITSLPPKNLTAVLFIFRLNKTIFVQKFPVAKNMTFQLAGYSEAFAGFGAELSILCDGVEIERAVTAFDVVSNHRQAIRYGFLSDFDTKDAGCDDVMTLRKYHINYVQYYDWSYRHDELVGPTERYSDMMGKPVDLNVVKEKIAACKRMGMKSLGYGAVYAASRNFFEKHPDWGFYTSAGKPLVFIDTFYLMNIQRNSPWREHIIHEYEKAVASVGFDGIHMDTYGFPKTAFSQLKQMEKLVKLEREYPSLIEETHTALNSIHPDSNLIFNNVGNWPVEGVAQTPQDAVYIEVWDPNNQYCHIRQIILDAKRACENKKPVILAAYLAPFRTDSPQRAENAALLLTAAIVSNGATHLLLGEKNAVLTQGYYVDHSFLSEQQADRIRKYYDFTVRYQELFYDKTMKDVSTTHIGWDNTEYKCIDRKWSPDGKPDTLWLTIRENDSRKIISIINLLGCGNDEWNEGKNTPIPQTNINFQVQLDRKIEGIYFASPDSENGRSVSLSYHLEQTQRGMAASFIVPKVNCWGVVYILMKTDFFD
jgi:dextranase